VKRVAGVALLLAGCTGGILRPRPAVVFEDTAVAYDWRADTGAAPLEVHGESCRNAVGLPLFIWTGINVAGWGDAGYRNAVAQAQAQAPGKTLSDVRADLHLINILVYRRECLQVTAVAR